jgi:hypothetical protein
MAETLTWGHSVDRNNDWLACPSCAGNTMAVQVLEKISQALFICFDFCILSKLRTSVKCFLDCEYGACLVCLRVVLLCLEESAQRIKQVI